MPEVVPETLRVHQANERTLLAWIRTGISLMALGFAIAHFGVFMNEMAAASASPARVGRGLGSAWVGATLVALGMLANLLATIRFARVRRAILAGQVGAPSPHAVYAFGLLATLIGLLMTMLLLQALDR